MKGMPLPITGDGTETRDWTYVGDIVQGLLAMGIKEKAIGEAFNLGAGKEQRVIDMANSVNELTNNPAGIRYAPRRTGMSRPGCYPVLQKPKRNLDTNPG